MGVAFAEVSPDICFCLIPVVIAALFLLPPVGFAIVRWWSVCWQRGNGDSLAVLPPLAASMVGGVMRVIVGADAFLLPEYHRNIHQPLVEISLWARWVGGLSRYCWCCFTLVPQHLA